MRKKLITLKLDEVDHEEWKRIAKKEGLGLSEWIRAKCNAQHLENGNGQRSDNTDVRRVKAVLPAGRGVDQQRGTTVPAEGDAAETCPHGAGWNQCKKWGCYFYEVPNGRWVRR